MSYTWPQDRDDYTPGRVDKMSDREDRSDSLQFSTPDGYRRTDHVNYDKDLDWEREQTPDSVTRRGGRDLGRRLQDEKHYSMERSTRDDSPVSAGESLRSEPISDRRREYRDRRSSPRYAHTVNNGPTYTPRVSKHRKMSTASMDSQVTDTSLPDKQRSRSHSIDSIASDYSSRTGTRSRRLSFAEGRALRRACERAQEEAKENKRREKDRERKQRYRENREKARNLDMKEEESDEEVLAEDLYVGDTVLISLSRGYGVVRWVGRLHFKTPRSDYWVGVELKDPRSNGKNNGSIRGKRYFTCKEGQGIFVKNVMKRISPEELLEQLAITRQKCKRVKKVLGEHKRARYQNDVLRSQAKTMEHEIEKLTRNNISNISKTIGNRMENFLNLLADNLTPGADDYRRAPRTMLTVLDLPPSRSSDEKILDWLYRKKCKKKLSTNKHPHFDDKSVTRAMLWLIKTLQTEVKDRRRQIDRRLEADRSRDYGDSDSE